MQRQPYLVIHQDHQHFQDPTLVVAKKKYLDYSLLKQKLILQSPFHQQGQLLVRFIRILDLLEHQAHPVRVHLAMAFQARQLVAEIFTE